RGRRGKADCGAIGPGGAPEASGTAAAAPPRTPPPLPPVTAPASHPAARARTGATPVRPARARRAKLVVRRIDPWSVLKFTLLFSLCLCIVFVVAVTALYFALDALGVFHSINDALSGITKATT